MQSETKQIWTVGIIFLAVIAILIISLTPTPEPPPTYENQLQTFNSLTELRNFVKASSGERSGFFGGMEKATADTASASIAAAGSAAGEGASEYSETNIQVEGVDEPDIVKNDGKYIYTLTGKKSHYLKRLPS